MCVCACACLCVCKWIDTFIRTCIPMQVDLFKGYSRTWAEYPVLVMIIKIFITMGVIFLLSAKIRQASPHHNHHDYTCIFTTHNLQTPTPAPKLYSRNWASPEYWGQERV